MKLRKYGYIFLIIIGLLIAYGINFLFKHMDSKITSLEINDKEIKIMRDVYNFNDIDSIELLDEVRLSGGTGSNTPNTNNGRYRVNDDKFESRVYIHKNISPFIRIKVKDSTIVFNENSSEKTDEIYRKIVKLKSNN